MAPSARIATARTANSHVSNTTPSVRTASAYTANSDISDMTSNASTTTSRTGGVAVPPVRSYQDRPFKCTLDWCQHRFETEKEMKIHKKYAEDHYYCKKCNVDCADWEDLTAHKVDAMAPHLEKRIKGVTIPHIVCEFCGQDFESFGGRKTHRAQAHPAEQDIICPGPQCNRKFVRAADMIEHLEKDQCPGIRAHEFRANIQHTYVVKQIWKEDLEQFRKNLNRNQVAEEQPGRISGSEDQHGEDDGEDDNEDGGVDILGQTDQEQMGGYKPLEPEVDLMSNQVSHSHDQRHPSGWPFLPNTKVDDLLKPLRSTHISSQSRKDSVIDDSDDETASQSTVTTATTQMVFSDTRPSAWSSQSTAKSLFPTAQKKPADFGAILQQRQQEIQLDDSSNFLKARVWHSGSADYNVDFFFVATIGKYCCPFPSCQGDGAEYLAASDMEEHILLKHTWSTYKCTGCFDIFKTVAGLVRHVETTKRCGIRSSYTFKSVSSYS